MVAAARAAVPEEAGRVAAARTAAEAGAMVAARTGAGAGAGGATVATRTGAGATVTIGETVVRTADVDVDRAVVAPSTSAPWR